MALYGTGTEPKVELLIAGTWTDISGDVRRDSTEQAITITRGRANEQSRVTAQTCEMNWDNRTGKYSNRNPTSTNYGKLPRSTQVRVSAGGEAANYWRGRLDYPKGGSTPFPSTPDVAALDVVGDLELRLDIEPTSWRPSRDMILASKYLITGDQRSWALVLQQSGQLQFFWSSAGTSASRVFTLSSNAVPITSGRLSIKVTLDVNNGAGGNTVAFATAPSIDGTYSALGANQINAGVTSIFASTAKLVAGAGDDVPFIVVDGSAFRGRYYKFRMYNGIAGSIVANPDFSAQTTTTTSFADSTGKTWTMGANQRITHDRMRFWGELSALPAEWDKSSTDFWTPVTASGMIRRLTQGANSLRSPLYRALAAKSLTSWLPLEDENGATVPATAVSGTNNGSAVAVSFGAVDTLPGSQRQASFTGPTSKIFWRIRQAGATGTQYFTVYFKITSLPVSNITFCTLTTSGTARKINLKVGPTQFAWEFLAADGTVLSALASAFGTGMTPTNQWIAFNLLLETSGGNVAWSSRWSNVLGESFVGVGPTTYAGSVGQLLTGTLGAAASTAFNDMSYAMIHTAASDLDFVDTGLAQAANAFFGEDACSRLARLAEEEGVVIDVDGDPTRCQTMGNQTVATFMDLVYECADADMGRLGESRDSLALTYRSRGEIEHALDVTLSHALSHLAKVPAIPEDDQGVTNDVTVQRAGGSTGRREIETGEMSVLAPPNGISRFESSDTVNVDLDSRLDDIASWKANIGSYGGIRVPRLEVGLHRSIIVTNDTLMQQIYRIDLGDTVNLTGLPTEVTPDDVLLLAEGYLETLTKELWTINFNTVPAEPYFTGRYNSSSVFYSAIAGQFRWDHSTSTLNGAHNSSTTSLSVALNSSTPTKIDRWTTTPSAWGFDIMVGGERMTVNSVAGTTSPQTFAVVRSVNGVVKAQASGTRVRLARPFRWKL